MDTYERLAQASRGTLIGAKTMKSPCLRGRKKHQFREKRTRGPLNLTYHGDKQCFWCGKTFRQVKREQRMKEPPK